MNDTTVTALIPIILVSVGMAFGLFLSAICTTESAALQAAVAAFYPTILLSGMFLLGAN